MVFRFVALTAFLAVAQAGIIAAPAAVSHSYSSQNSVSHGYAAPAYTHGYAAPAYTQYAAPAVAYAAPAYKAVAAPVYAKTVVAEPFAEAHYDFEYAIQDPHTGDFKSQKESRKGDAVQGSYSLIEADGSKRIVEYTADDHNGFQAIVHREPAAHPVAVKAVAPIVKYAAAAPALTYSHAAPAYVHAAPAYAHAAPAYAHATFAAPSHAYHH